MEGWEVFGMAASAGVARLDKLSRATGCPSEALLRTFPWLARCGPKFPLHIGYKDVVRLRSDWYLAVHTDRRVMLYGAYSLQGLCLAERDIRLHCTPDCQIERGKVGGVWDYTTCMYSSIYLKTVQQKERG